MTGPVNSTEAVLGLDTAEVAEVLRELLLEADLQAGTARPGADLDTRVAEDREFLRAVVLALGVEPGSTAEQGSPQRLLAALIEEVPQTRSQVENALASLEDRETSLDFGASVAVAALAVAASAAIIRPLVTWERERDGVRESTRLKVDIRGTNIGKLLRELLPFLGGPQ